MQYVPHIPEWVALRPRLYARFDPTSRGELVMVHGPAGTGKTLAVADWARSRQVEGVWVTLDPSTHTRQTVWRRIIRALDLPDAASLLAEFESTDPGMFREAVGWALAAQPRVIVIDEIDYADDPALVEDLLYLRSAGSAGFVLIGRVPVGLAGRASSTDSILFVAPEELSLTSDETIAVLAACGVPASLAPLVQERIHGWPQGTRAAARALASHESTDGIVQVVERSLDDEAAGVLSQFAQWSEDTVRTARLCAVLGPAPQQMIAELLPGVDTTVTLAEIVTAGAGMWADSAAGPMFRVAPHIGVVLQRNQGVSAELQSPALVGRVAQLAEESGRSADAARHLRALGDWDALRELAKRNFRDALVLDKQDWLAITRTIPITVLQREPVLAVLHALLVNADPASGASQLRATVGLALAHITNRLHASPDPVDEVWTTVSLLGAQRLAGKYASSWKTAASLDALLNSLTASQRDSVAPLLSVARLQIGSTRFYAGAIEQSREDFARSLRAPVVAEWGVLHARSMVALSHAMEGRFTAVEQSLTSVYESPKPRSWRGTYSAAGTHLAEAMMFLERGYTEEAIASIDAIEHHYETIEHWPLMLWVRSQVSLLGDPSGVREWDLAEQIRRRSHRAPTSEWMNSLLVALRVDLLLAAGEDARAGAVLEQTRKSQSMPLRIARARMSLFTGDFEAAVARSTRILAEDVLTPRSRLSALLLNAVGYSRLGVGDRADGAAREASAIMGAHRLVSPLRAIAAEDRRRLGLDSSTNATAGSPEPDPFGSRPPRARLTTTERTVLAALVLYSSATDIAAALFVSPNTVKAHLRSIYRKLGASTRAQALATARTMGLLPEG